MTTVNEQALSVQIENILVARNPRGMATLQPELSPGYFLRAAKMLKDVKGTVLIGTGFPVLDTFETDGPVGAIALYQALEALGAHPIIACGAPLSKALEADYRIHELSIGPDAPREQEAIDGLAELNPAAIISIERPGLAHNEAYHNMRGEDISARAACFDYFLRHATCPTMAIGDGGNEIGMGNVHSTLDKLDIVPAATCCDELLISDVSNWGAFGLIAFWSLWSGQDLLGKLDSLEVLKYLSARGSVDGVTRENQLTEDNYPASEGESVLAEIRSLIGFA